MSADRLGFRTPSGCTYEFGVPASIMFNQAKHTVNTESVRFIIAVFEPPGVKFLVEKMIISGRRVAII
eukprot:scaffold64473_cov21-Prasinocladus_malaysianus.AAC.1